MTINYQSLTHQQFIHRPFTIDSPSHNSLHPELTINSRSTNLMTHHAYRLLVTNKTCDGKATVWPSDHGKWLTILIRKEQDSPQWLIMAKYDLQWFIHQPRIAFQWSIELTVSIYDHYQQVIIHLRVWYWITNPIK